jgi:hypothetical protein
MEEVKLKEWNEKCGSVRSGEGRTRVVEDRRD